MKLRGPLSKSYTGEITDIRNIKGAFLSVPSILIRNQIPAHQRQKDASNEFMVYVHEDQSIYRLKNNPSGDTTVNSDWDLIFTSALSGLTVQGSWDASTNTPTLSDATAAEKGTTYYVWGVPNQLAYQYAGLFDGALESFLNGYLVVSNGSRWVVVKNDAELPIPVDLLGTDLVVDITERNAVEKWIGKRVIVIDATGDESSLTADGETAEYLYDPQNVSADADGWILINRIDLAGFYAETQSQGVNYAVTAGTSTAFTANFNPSIQVVAEGQPFRIKLHTTVGASPTLDVGDGNALPLVKSINGVVSTTITSADAKEGQTLLIVKNTVNSVEVYELISSAGQNIPNTEVVIGTGEGVSSSSNLTFDGTTLDLTGNLAVVGQADIDNVQINGNTITSSDTNGNLVLTANGTGIVEIQRPLTVDSIGVNNNLTVTGDLIVNGTTTTINTATVQVEDNLLVINYGDVGTGVTAGIAGIEVERGTLTNYQFLFDESDDLFKIGEVGSLQAVATREIAPNDTALAIWNNTSSQFETSLDLTFITNSLDINADLGEDSVISLYDSSGYAAISLGGGWSLNTFAGTTLTDFAITNDNTGENVIFINDQNLITISDATNTLGMQYAGDYSTNNAANDRWIVDKGYVDSEITAIPTPTLQSVLDAGNTATIAGSNIFELTRNEASTNTLIEIAKFGRRTTGVGANNIGGYITLEVESAGADIMKPLQIKHTLIDAGNTTADSQFSVSASNNNVTQDFLNISPVKTVIGAGASAAGGNAISIGPGTTNTGASAIAMGNGASAAGNFSMAFGFGAGANNTESIAFGASTIVRNQTMSIGHYAESYGVYGIAFGYESYIGSASPYGIAVGYGARVDNTSSVGGIAIGRNINSEADGAIIMGYHTAIQINSVSDSFMLAWDADTVFHMKADDGLVVSPREITTAADSQKGISFTQTLNDPVDVVAGADYTGFHMNIIETDITGWQDGYQLMDLQVNSSSVHSFGPSNFVLGNSTNALDTTTSFRIAGYGFSGQDEMRLERIWLGGAYGMELVSEDVSDGGKSSLRFSNGQLQVISNERVTLQNTGTSSGKVVIKDVITSANTSAFTLSNEARHATLDEAIFKFEGDSNKLTSGSYTGILLDVTDIASPEAINYLLDLQVGGSTVFNVQDDGTINVNGAPLETGIGGSIADNQIAVGASTADNIEGSADFIYTGSLASLTTSSVNGGFKAISTANDELLVSANHTVFNNGAGPGLRGRVFSSTRSVVHNAFVETATEDAGTLPVTEFHSARWTGSGTDVVTRPLFGWYNNETQVAEISANGGVTIGTPTGGSQGFGTINATGLYVDGVAVSSGGIGGSITDNQIAVGATTANNIEGGSSFTWNGTWMQHVALGGSLNWGSGMSSFGHNGAGVYQQIESSTDSLVYLANVDAAQDTGTVPLIKITARQADNTDITTRPLLGIYNRGTLNAEISASGNWDFKGNNLTNVGVINGEASNLQINTGTSDTTDNASLQLGGGGNASNSRGGSIILYGNEVTSGTHSGIGGVTLQAGFITNSAIDLIANATNSAVNIRTSTSSTTIDYAFSESGFDAFAHSIDTTGTISAGRLDVDNLRLDGNTISSTDTNGDINLTPNGTGRVLSNVTNFLVGTADAGDKYIQLGNTSGATISDGEYSRFFAQASHNATSRTAEIGVYTHASISNAVGFIRLDAEDGANDYLWLDNTGILRTSTTIGNLGTATGTIIGSQTSDYYLKDISEEPFKYGLNDLLALKPIEYKFKDNSESRIGFEAHHTRSIISEAVYDTKEIMEGADHTKLAMYTADLLAVTVAGIQELNTATQSRFETNEEKIARLEKRVSDLESQLNI